MSRYGNMRRPTLFEIVGFVLLVGLVVLTMRMATLSLADRVMLNRLPFGEAVIYVVTGETPADVFAKRHLDLIERSRNLLNR